MYVMCHLIHHQHSIFGLQIVAYVCSLALLSQGEVKGGRIYKYESILKCNIFAILTSFLFYFLMLIHFLIYLSVLLARCFKKKMLQYNNVNVVINSLNTPTSSDKYIAHL